MALKLGAKILLGVLAIIAGMAALIVIVGGRGIGAQVEAEVRQDLDRTAKTVDRVQDEISSNLAQLAAAVAQSPAIRAAVGTLADPATAAQTVGEALAPMDPELALIFQHSPQPIPETSTLTGVLEKTGSAPRALLGEPAPASGSDDLFGGGGAGAPWVRPSQLAGLHWPVGALPEAIRTTPLVRAIQALHGAWIKAFRDGGAQAPHGAVLASSFAGRLYLVAVEPVVQGGQYLGILCMGTEVGDKIAGRISAATGLELSFLRIDAGGGAQVVGSSYEPQAGRTTRAQRYAAMVDDSLLRADQPPRAVDEGDRRYLVQANPLVKRRGTESGSGTRAQPVPGSDPSLTVIEEDLTSRLGILGPLNHTLFLVSGTVALLGVLLITAVTRVWVTGPVEELTKGMLRIQAGDLATPITVASNDEMGDLASAFNQTQLELRKKEQYMRMVSKSAVDAVESKITANLAEGGERRVVTMLFSDIRDFTTLCEKIDPNKLVHLLNRYFDAMVEIIYRHHGQLDKFIGDAIMAMFDGPDHPRNAVLAAVEMQAEVRRLDRDESLGLRIGIGVHTGEVIAGFVGAKQFMNHTFLGDAVNLAARLEGESKHGKHTAVVISQATLDAVPGLVEVELMAKDKVKGKTQAVKMYEVVRVIDSATVVGGLDSPDPKVRAEAARFAARLGGAAALPRLVSLGSDADEGVAIQALVALGDCPPGTEGFEAVAAELSTRLAKETRVKVRSALVTALGKLGSGRSLPALVAALGDPEPRVRANAIEAVKRCAALQARDLIRPLLGDENNRVQANAAVAVFDEMPQEVTDVLVGAIRSPDPMRRASAAYAAGALARRYPPELVDPHRARDLDHHTFLIHSCLQRLGGVLAAACQDEREEIVLRNMVPALVVILGRDVAQPMLEEVLRGKRDDAEASGALSRSMPFGLAALPTNPDETKDPLSSASLPSFKL